MSVRVVARIRPLLKNENEKDIIVTPADSNTVVRIPNPKKDAELYSFQFSNVFDQAATQAEIFDKEGETESTAPEMSFEKLTRLSRAHCKTPVQRLRCHPFRIRRHRNGKDTHHEGR